MSRWISRSSAVAACFPRDSGRSPSGLHCPGCGCGLGAGCSGSPGTGWRAACPFTSRALPRLGEPLRNLQRVRHGRASRDRKERATSLLISRSRASPQRRARQSMVEDFAIICTCRCGAQPGPQAGDVSWWRPMGTLGLRGACGPSAWRVASYPAASAHQQRQGRA